MKLTIKLTLHLLVVVLFVVGIDSWITLRTELAQIDQEARRDATVLAIALRAVVESAESNEGHARAMQLIDAVNEADPDLSARIIPRGGRRTGEEGRFVTAVSLHDQPEMVLEVAESTRVRDAHVVRTIQQSVVVGIVLVAIAGLLSIFLGRWQVGRPLERLVAAARQIAKGAPHEPIVVSTGAELIELAAEMNLMSEAIDEARRDARMEAEERVRTVEQLRHAERLGVVGRMAACVAHEIGTPIHVIAARAGLIVENTGDSEAVRNATIIRSQTDRITKIVRQLLGFARQQPSERQSLDLAALVEGVVDGIQILTPQTVVRLEVDMPHVQIEGDPTQLSQVLTNVLVNAVDSGAREVVVSLVACEARGKSTARTRIVDDGCGMSSEVLRKVFDPFFTTKDVGMGTGLGLAVSLGIVEEHGGWFEVQSEPDGGTQTDLFLPCSV